MPGERPWSEHIGAGIGERTDERDAAQARRKRQDIVIGQQNNRPPPRLAGEFAPGSGNAGGGRGRRTAPVGIVEKTKPLLQGEHPAHGGIDRANRNHAACDRRSQALAIRAAHHVDIDASLERRRCRLDEIACDAMAYQFGDRVVVTDDHTIETRCPAQPITQQRDMGGQRDAGDIVEGWHDRGAA